MLRRTCLLLALAPLFLLAPGVASAGSAEYPADPESAKLGVATYVLARTGNHVDLEARDSHGAQLGTISAELDTPDGLAIDFRNGDEDLHMTWSLTTGKFALTDNRTGEWMTSAPDPRDFHQTLFEGTPALLTAHRAAAALAVVAVEQAMLRLGVHPNSRLVDRSQARTPQAGACPVPPSSTRILSPRTSAAAPTTPSLGACTGPMVDSYIAYGSTKSVCCYAATDNVNLLCSNSCCLGCCQIIGCDAACVIAPEILCSCNATGISCEDDCQGGGGGDGGGGGGGAGCHPADKTKAKGEGKFWVSCPAECFSCG